jgi:hypothetical protein
MTDGAGKPKGPRMSKSVGVIASDTLLVRLAAPVELFAVDLSARDPCALADPTRLDQPGVEALLSQLHGRAPWNPPRQIWIQLPAEHCTPTVASELQAALIVYAARRADETAREYHEFMWSSAGFLVGGVVLAVLGLAAQIWLVGHPPSADPIIAGGLSLGVDIAIWVALWAPISAFLQDWFPFARRRQRYRRLGRLPVQVHPLP